MAAIPVAKVVRLPPVTLVKPTESVSATTGRTWCACSPSTSAACMAMEARVPPMSVEPSTRLTVPSSLTLMVQEDCRPTLNQKPWATPRPRRRPSPPRGREAW